MRLNLGCGLKPLKGFVNHDIVKHSDFVDLVFDLGVIPYPIPDDSCNYIKMINVLEHIRIPNTTRPYVYVVMEELYRICKDGAIIELEVPFYNSASGFSLDHISFFNLSSFWFVEGNLTSNWEVNFKGKIVYDYKKCSWLGKLVPTIPLCIGAYKNFRDLAATHIGHIYTHLKLKIKVEKVK